MPTDITIPATDGRPLAATLYTPESPNNQCVIIGSATGVKRGFYGHYAAFLAENGYTALTFDYRGVGDSLNGRLQDDPATFSDWGQKDLSGIIRWANVQYPNQNLHAVCHSVGGIMVGLSPASAQLASAIFVAPPNFYWRYRPPIKQIGVFLQVYVMTSWLTRFYGYFPGNLLGYGENLPPNTMLEWCRWSRHPDYAKAFVVPHVYDSLTIPLTFYSFEDDPLAPRLAVNGAIRLYTRARIEHRQLRPSDLNETEIGHFGFFRRKFRQTLWQESLGLLARTS